jgi:hypothetical protein
MAGYGKKQGTTFVFDKEAWQKPDGSVVGSIRSGSGVRLGRPGSVIPYEKAKALGLTAKAKKAVEDKAAPKGGDK